MNPDATMNDWGEDGPLLGPFEWVQITYFQTVRCGLADGGEVWLTRYDDMVFYDGMYYGDFDVLSSKNSSRISGKKVAPYEPKLAELPEERRK
jgi:hypothetical protein